MPPSFQRLIQRLALCLAAALSLHAALPAHAQAPAWPSKPIKVIVPFPAGSATDSISRLVAVEMAPILGQPVVIDNRPGANGSIAAELVAHSPADGYTLLMGTNSQYAANVSLFKKLPYNPVTDFAPIARLTTQPSVLVVRADSPVKTLPEFVALARQKPLAGGYGGASTQIAIAMFGKLAGVALQEVPYKGSPQTMVDVLGGTLDFTFTDLGNGLTFARDGKMRALGVTSAQRSPLAPSWPAISETYPGMDIIGWHGLVAPAGTPGDAVQKVYQAAATAMTKASVTSGLAKLGISPAVLPPDEMGKLISQEIARWALLVKDAGITPE